MKVTVDKCALNSRGFTLPDMYLSGEFLTFQANGPKSCHGQLAYTPEGTSYEFNVHATDNSCGADLSIDEINGSYSWSNTLQAFPNGVSGDDFTMMDIKVACNNSPSIDSETSDEQPFGASTISGDLTVNYEGISSETPGVKSYQKNYVNKVPSLQTLYVMDFFGISGSLDDYLIWDTELPLPYESQVLRAERCWLSNSPDPSVESSYDIGR